MGIPELIIIVIMIACNAVFAGYELALASVNLGRLKLLADGKAPGAKAALAMKMNMESSLAVVQIGITLVGAIAAATGGAQAEETISPQLQRALGVSESIAEAIAIALVVIPLSAITIIAGELIPKTAAIKHNERVCLLLSPIMRGLSFLFYPAVIVFEATTKRVVALFEKTLSGGQADHGALGVSELRAYARALRTGRLISDDQERIILGASNLTRTRVADIAVPPEDIVMLPAGSALPDHFVTVHLEGFTRFPVAEVPGDPQTIIGYVNLKELLFLAKTHPEKPDLRSIIRPLDFFRPDETIGTAFSVMMERHTHLAMVKDGGGVIRGMLTLEDILEEVVGDIQDEFDRMPRYITTSGDQYVVAGGAFLAQVFERIGRPELASDVPAGMTFCEWINAEHDARIRGGDIIRIRGIRILIRKTRRNRVLEAMVLADRPALKE